MYCVYIIYSEKTGKYYAGNTHDIDERLKRHNEGRSTYTKKGVPWKLITKSDCATRSDAVQLESRIRNRGIKRYLEDNIRGVAQSG